MTDTTINGRSRCLLSSVYIHPGVDASHLKIFLFSTLVKYSETSLLIDQEFHIDKDVPIIVMGDFNVDVKRNANAFGFMKKHFDLNMVPTNYPSTLDNSYIDSTFTRNISTELYQEDPLIEIPHLAGNELVKKSQLTRMDIRGLVVRCTSCLHQINHHDPDKLKKHIRLNVIICSDCYDFYGTSEFSQDESGNYNYCTWCGNGGKLFLCDYCPNTFCSTCVRRNFGRAAVSEMTKEGWKCYCCDPSKLNHKVAFCDLILEYSKNVQRKINKKTSPSAELNKNGIKNWPESHNLLLSAFDSVDDSCKSFHRRVEKLKNIGVSQSKSLKHIIAKFEEIVNSHRAELNHEVKSLFRQYISYMENQKKIEYPEKSSESKDDGVAEKTESETGLEKIESKSDLVNDAAEIVDSLKADQSGDVEMENLDDHKDESKADDNETKINEDNYKAKLSLLNQAESSLSEIDDILAEAPLMDDSDEGHSKNAKTETEEKPLENDKNVNEADNEKKTMLNGSDSDIAELFCSKSDNVKKVSVNRKLDFESFSSSSSVPEDSESSIYLSSGGELERRPRKKEKKKSMKKTVIRKVVTKDDPKLKLRTSVLLKSCAHLLPNGETTIPLPTSYQIEDLDKEIKSLIKDPIKRDRRKSSDTEKKKKPKAIKKPKVSKKKYSGSSSSICLSSSEDEEITKKKLFKATSGDDPNTLAKKKILSMASDESSYTDSSEEEEEEPKKKSRKGKTHSGSSDDFQPKKKKKFDKLLHKRILSDDSDFEGEKKIGERKKSTKRKKLASDESENKKLNSDETTSSDSEEDKQRKKKKRKRIKKAAASSSSDEGKKKDEEGASQSTPGKGRKNIKKILSKKDLAMETKEAQNLERERRRRVQERQKMYNVITDTTPDGSQVITRKMVLEIDPNSKEEIVQIHPDLVEKLKPHQVNGIKFMWECTIESLKQLETENGSGCILAHCMGLGKTLQVITFLHTCLTNKHVNKYIKTALVICPYNTVLNWSKEFDYWLQDVDGNVLVHELTLAKDNYARVDVLEYWKRDGGVLIISYDLFRRLASTKIKGLKSKSKAAIYSSLIDPGPDIVICDEGHVLKNVNSAISKACGTINTQRRIVLTGTPLQNNLLEYHCMLSFVKPHLLGTPKEFRNRFVNPIMNGQYDDSTEYDVKRMKKRIHILHKLLEGCVQ
ncbi:Transcriptional regulator ATRX, partial [Araneus ventricosus]